MDLINQYEFLFSLLFKSMSFFLLCLHMYELESHSLRKSTKFKHFLHMLLYLHFHAHARDRVNPIDLYATYIHIDFGDPLTFLLAP